VQRLAALLKADTVRAELCRVPQSRMLGPEPSKMWCRPLSAGRYPEYSVINISAVYRPSHILVHVGVR
jgi:hypothetical protein